MSDYVLKSIGDGIDLLSCPADRFKTNETAICLATELNKSTASVNALIAGLLCRSSKEYPDISSLNKKLAMLYGASIQPVVMKIGECQIIKIGLTCIDDRFSLSGGSISGECLKLLLSLLFEPKLDDNGLFSEKNIETEKRVLREKIEAEENEKRTFALRRTEEIMFENEPYGINRFGTKEDIDKITPKAATDALKNLLQTSKILVTMVGNADADKASKIVKDCFGGIQRSYKNLPKPIIVPKADKIKEVTDRIDVKQGKLVLGLRVNINPDDSLAPAMRTFTDIFGGGPYSKLFMNVREKMSLCYYCSARYTRSKSVILIQCGCEEENMDKAVKEIKAQLEEIKKGDFDDELASSKMAISDALMSVYDAPEVIESWYTGRMTENKFETPRDSVKENNAVTKEDVIECASLVSFDTVYKLTSIKEGNE